jgi:hypothetical protein
MTNTMAEQFSFNKLLLDQHVPTIAKNILQLTSADTIITQVADLCTNAAQPSNLHVFMHKFSAHIHLLRQHVQQHASAENCARVTTHVTLVSHLCVILFTMAKLHWQNTTADFVRFKNVCFRAIHSTIAEHIEVWNELFNKNYDLLVSPPSVGDHWKGVICAIKMFAQKMYQDVKESILEHFDLDDHLDADENSMRVAVARETLERLQSSYHFRNTLFVCYFFHDVLHKIIPEQEWIVGTFNRTVDAVGSSELTKFLQGKKHVFLNSTSENPFLCVRERKDELQCKYRHNIDVPITLFHVPFLLTIDQRLKTLENCHAVKAYMAAKAYAHKTADFSAFFAEHNIPSAHATQHVSTACPSTRTDAQIRTSHESPAGEPVSPFPENRITQCNPRIFVHQEVSIDQSNNDDLSIPVAAAASSSSSYCASSASSCMRYRGISHAAPVAIVQTRKRCRSDQGSDDDAVYCSESHDDDMQTKNTEQVKRLKNSFETCQIFDDASSCTSEFKDNDADSVTKAEKGAGDEDMQEVSAQEEEDGEDSEYDEEHDAGDLQEEELDDGDIDVTDVQKRVHLTRGRTAEHFLNSVLGTDRAKNLLSMVTSFEHEPEACDRGGVSSEGFRLFFKEILLHNEGIHHPLFQYDEDTSMYWPRRYDSSNADALCILDKFWEGVGTVIALAFHNNNWQALSSGISPLLMIKLLKEEPMTTAHFQSWDPVTFKSATLMQQCPCTSCVRQEHPTNTPSVAIEGDLDSGTCRFYGVEFEALEDVSVLDLQTFCDGHAQRTTCDELPLDWTRFLQMVGVKSQRFDISTLERNRQQTKMYSPPVCDEEHNVQVTLENSNMFVMSSCLQRTGFPWYVDARDGCTKKNPFTNSAWLCMLKGIRSLNDRREWDLFGTEELSIHFNKTEMLKLVTTSDLQAAVEYRGFLRTPSSSGVCSSGYTPTNDDICATVRKHLQLHSAEVHMHFYQYLDWFWTTVALFNKSELEFLLMFMASDADIIRKLVAKEVNIVIILTEGDNDTLPTASTCFNTIKLPLYSTKEALQKNLRKILDYSEGFGVE